MSPGNLSADASPALAAPVNCSACGQLNQSPGALAGSAGFGQLVYAVGHLSAQICSLEVDKAFAQLTAGAHQGDQVEVALLKQVLENPENVWLGSYLGWVFTSASEGIDIFNVLPRNDADVTRLAELLSPVEADEVVHVAVGKTVPTPLDSPCAALGLPTVQADRVMAFTLQEFAAAMPWDETSRKDKPTAAGGKDDRAEFEGVVRRFFLRLTNGTGNRGFAPEHVACNYLACEFAPLFRAVWQAQRDGKVLVGVDARHVHSADRRIVAVRVTVRQRQTEVIEPYQIMVDATNPPGPFVVSGPRLVYD